MSTPGSRVMTIGLIVMLLSVSTGMHFGGFGLLLCFVGVVVGANLVVAGVGTADRPAPNPIVPVVFSGARSLAAFVCRNTATVGLALASCAVTMVSGEAHLALCFATFALLLLGVSLTSIGARGE
ncbi:unnamed protein product [Miscanthus lutarioriparius]|uniref:Uncharacterized protein n=1 Tax=Miscanthus lutarioriparius TaxID=422564 RepID=A0A811PW67_9POAL|nr:unnamed protein product [Miscanthus lutarioriparius]